MIKRILFIAICIISFNSIIGQEEAATSNGVLPSDIPLHNSIKYNRFLFNPTFSFVRENKNSINAYNRNPRSSFSDNSQTYFMNYSAKFQEKMGAGIGLFQQNVGIFRYFGATLNYGYNVELDRDMNLTFGMNLNYSQSALKSNLDQAQADDDVINNYQNSSVFLLHPGINFNWESFDVGVSAGNLVAYNVSSSELLTDSMVLTGHVMYTSNLDWREDNEIRAMGYASKPGEEELRYGGNVIFEIPKYGWAQLGYNSYYGGAIGIGANVTPTISIGYTVEPGIGGEAIVAEFGATHEFGLAFNFAEEKPRRGSKSKTSTQKAYEARDSEIRRLKKEILEQNKIIRDLQDEQGDSQSQEQQAMSELERSIAEAKEKEAKAARELELQREEEVKLLNKQAEEERLAAQKELEREVEVTEEERLAAQKKLEREEEELRLASQKKLEVEMSQQESEEDKIAAEEAAREAEAAQQQAEEEIAEQKAEEERLAAQKKLELEMAEQRLADEAAEAARLAEEQRLAAEAAEAARLAEEQRLADEAAEAARLAEEQRLADEAAEAARLAEEQRLADEAAEAARLAEEQRLADEAAEAARLAEEQRLADEAAEAARLAEEQRLADEAAEAARLAEAAEAARLAEEQRLADEAAEAARLAEEQRLADEAAEAARLAEEQRLADEAAAAAEAARLAEEQRLAAAAAAAPPENKEALDEIKKELDNNSRISSKIFARRDSLLTTSLNVDKREFNKLLESLVNMNDDASDPSSSKRLSANNRFVKFADATRPEAQFATKYIPGYPEGYYLIGNVFKGGAYAEKFSSTLKDLGFNNSQIIVNPENQFQYVAIESYTDKDEAARQYLSSIDNKYYGDMWILHIAKSRVESFKRLLQETKLITDTVKDDTVLTESLSYIGGHNIENGYYLITNIFKRENYFERGMAKLKEQGLEPQFFRNPKDNYIYVYLKRYDSLDEAKQSLFSNVNNSYNGDLYILKIQ